MLHVPLTLKLIGANAIIVVAAIVATGVRDRAGESGYGFAIPLVALALGAVANAVLVSIALRPIRDLQRAVRRLWVGESNVRVPSSDIGDHALDQVGGAINLLLDRLDNERTRMRALAAEIIRVEDRERARIGHELHESIAQTLVGVTYQLSAAERETSDAVAATRLREIRLYTAETLDRVDILSHSVHPRVLNDLGLVAGLRELARLAATPETPVEVELRAGSEVEFRGLGHSTAAALYRIAQEAIQNARRHAHAGRITVEVAARDGVLTMDIVDDGDGFVPDEAVRRRPATGLFTMRERAALIDASFGVYSEPGRGTRVSVALRG
jgi:signal transduction histidine kinase